MKDSDIDFSDIPELGPDFFANAMVWRPQEERNKCGADAHIPRPPWGTKADVVKVKSPRKRRTEKA